MKKREELNKLVVAIVRIDRVSTTREIYEKIKDERGLLKEEGIRGFRSFARILPVLDGLKQEGKKGSTIYKLK
jgi:arginine repressor